MVELIRDATAPEPQSRLCSLSQFRERLEEVAERALGPEWIAAGTVLLAGLAATAGSGAVAGATATTATAAASGAAAGTLAGSASSSAAAAAGTTVASTTATAGGVAAGSGAAGTTTGGLVAAIAAKPVLAAGVALAGAAAVGGGTYAATQYQEAKVSSQTGTWEVTSRFDSEDFTLRVAGACFAEGSSPDDLSRSLRVSTREEFGSQLITPEFSGSVVGALQGRFRRDGPTYHVLAYECRVDDPVLADLPSGDLRTRRSELAVFNDALEPVALTPATTTEAVNASAQGQVGWTGGVLSAEDAALGVDDGKPTLSGSWQKVRVLADHYVGQVTLTSDQSGRIRQNSEVRTERREGADASR